MRDSIKEAIKRIYLENNYGEFIQNSRKQINILDTFRSLLNKYITDITEMNINNAPSCVLYIDYEEYKNVKYRTLVYISKIVPIFYVQHEFEVANENPKRIEPSLEGFGGEAYISAQYDVHETITNKMKQLGYEEIKYREFIEEILYKSDNKKQLISGQGYSVSELLFNDMFEINDEYL